MTTEERLEKLEKEVRIAKTAYRSLAISLCLCMALGVLQIVDIHFQLTSQGKFIRARSIELVDETGMSFISLGAIQGRSQVSLSGKDGKSSLTLSVGAEGPSLMLSQNKANAWLKQDQLYFNEDNGKPTAHLAAGGLSLSSLPGSSLTLASSDTGAEMTMIGKHGSFWLDTDKDGETSMKLMDRSYTVRSSLGIGNGEKSGMVLMDAKGQRSWASP